MSQLPSMPLWVADFYSKTYHLAGDERLAYLDILMKTWVRNCQPFTDEPREMASVVGVTVKRWLKIRPKLVPFFDLSGGTWRQVRLEQEWEFVSSRAELSRRNGALGGRPKSRKINKIENPEVNPEETRTKPTHTHTQLDPEADASGADAPRDPAKEMWSRGKAVLGKSSGSLIGQALKEHKPLAVMEAIIATESANPPDPIAFFLGCLKQRGRNDRSQQRAYDILAQAAIDHDEREGNSGPAETPDRPARRASELADGGLALH